MRPDTRHDPTSPPLWVAVCTVCTPSVTVTVTPPAGRPPASSAVPCSDPEDAPRDNDTPVSSWPSARVTLSVWDARPSLLATSVYVAGVGSLRRVKLPSSLTDIVVADDSRPWP